MEAATGLAVTDVGAGPAVLLVHGQPGSRADWLGLVPLLSEDFRVLSVDRPGYGTSGGEAVGLLENAEQLGKLLVERNALGATVVGHSLGAGIALAMAERSLGVGALVLVGAAGVEGQWGSRPPARAPARELARHLGGAAGRARARPPHVRPDREGDRRLGADVGGKLHP